MCPNCRAFITTDDKICPYCQAQVGPRAIDVRSRAEAMTSISHHRFATTVILLINTGLYLATTVRSMQRVGGGVPWDLDGNTLVEFGAKLGSAIFYGGEWWRLITAGFLHGGILHILMNSWVLFDLGPQVDQAFGTSRFLVIYLVSNVTGYLASLYFVPEISIGASAALCGLIGAMLALAVRDRSSYASAMRNHYIQWIIYLAVFGFVIPGIDNYAHGGGLIGGFALGYLAGTPSYSEGKETFWKVASWAAIAITAFAFYKMFMQLISPG
jgi:membrane associated rhomboid family serine protease